MAAQLIVRLAQMDDLQSLMSLAERYCAADNALWDPARAERGFVPLLNDTHHGIVLLTAVDSEIVGYAVLTWGWSIEAGGREALLDEMYVDRPGRGYGSALIEAVIDAAAAAGASRVFLETESSNVSARLFWLQHGFHLEDSIWLQRSCTPGKARVTV